MRSKYRRSIPPLLADNNYGNRRLLQNLSHFWDLGDFYALIAKAHQCGLKLILDFAPNHMSDQHRWLVEGRSSRSNPKRDWYIWRDAKPDGSQLNNWVNDFGNSA